MRRTHINAALIAAMAALLMLSACGRSNQEAESTPPPALRTPIPTFTPTASTTESASASTSSSQAASNPADNLASSSSTSPAASAPAANDIAARASDPAPASALSTGLTGVGGPLEAPAAAAPLQPALGIVNTQLVNSRSGPDTTYDVVMIVGAGENYDITGKSGDGAWVRICCLEQQEAWVKAEFLDITGALDSLPVAQAGERSGQTVTRSAAAAQATVAAALAGVPASAAASAPAAPSAAPAADVNTANAAAASVAETADNTAAISAANSGAESAAAPEVAAAEAGTTAAITADAAAAAEIAAGALQLAGQEQFPETNVVRVFLFAYQGTDALEGYSLRVRKDGVDQPSSGISFGGRPGMTWPIADDRQRFQNLKVEFPGVAAAGVWEVTVMKEGVAVGPPATFTLAEGDPNQELYVRYVQP